MEGLAFATAFNQVDEWLDVVTTDCNCLVNWTRVDCPNIDSKVLSTASEYKSAVRRDADVCNLVWVRDETHGFVWIAIERQFDEADDLLVRGVEQVLLVTVFIVEQLELVDLSTVGLSETSASRVLGCWVPQFHLVLVVSGQNKALLKVQIVVPDTCCWVSFKLNVELSQRFQLSVLYRVGSGVLEDTTIGTDGEESLLNVVVSVEHLTEAD